MTSSETMRLSCRRNMSWADRVIAEMAETPPRLPVTCCFGVFPRGAHVSPTTRLKKYSLRPESTEFLYTSARPCESLAILCAATLPVPPPTIRNTAFQASDTFTPLRANAASLFAWKPEPHILSAQLESIVALSKNQFQNRIQRLARCRSF